MARIKNKSKILVKENPVSTDYFPASDSEDNGKTINIEIGSILGGAVSAETPATIKTKYESNVNTNTFTDAEKTKLENLDENQIVPTTLVELDTVVTGSELNDLKVKSDNIEDNATADQTGSEIKAAYEAELDTNAFTDGEKTKLAGLESSHFKGSFVNISSLQTAFPTAVVGDYADVDAGVGTDVQRYIWDDSDSNWVVQQSSGGSETAASIKTKYESNLDTNAFTDSEQSNLANQSGVNTGDQDLSNLVTKDGFDLITGQKQFVPTGNSVAINAQVSGSGAAISATASGIGSAISGLTSGVAPAIEGVASVLSTAPVFSGRENGGAETFSVSKEGDIIGNSINIGGSGDNVLLDDGSTTPLAGIGSGGSSSVFMYNVKDYGAIGDGTADDTVAIQAAIQAAFDAGGGVVFFPNGVYFIDGAKDSASDSQLYFPLSSYTDSKNLKTIKLLGETPPNQFSNPFDTLNSSSHPENGVILKSNMLTTGNVIGSRDEVVSWGNYNFIQAHIENISVRVRSMTGSTDVQPLATAINMGNVYNFTAHKIEVCPTSDMNTQLEPAISSIGVVMPRSNNFCFASMTDFFVYGFYIGVDLYEHNNLDRFNVDVCVIGLNLNAVNHSIYVSKGAVQRCRINVQCQNSSYFYLDVTFEDDYAKHVITPTWNTTLYDLYDADGTSFGFIRYHVVRSGFGVDYSVFNTNASSNISLLKIWETEASQLPATSIDLTGLIAYWKFEETTGDYLDSSGNNLNAVKVNAPSTSSGKLGNSMFTDESLAQYANAGASGLSYVSPDFTICGWFKIDTSAQQYQVLFNKAGTLREYNLYYRKSTGRIIGVFYDGAAVDALVQKDVNENEWFFVVFERIGNTVSLSVNLSVKDVDTGTQTTPETTNDLTIGNGDTAGQSLNGGVDELSFWNRQLSASEQEYIYNSGTGRELN